MNDEKVNLIWNRIDGVYIPGEFDMEDEGSTSKKRGILKQYAFSVLLALAIKAALALLGSMTYFQHKTHTHLKELVSQQFLIHSAIGEMTRELRKKTVAQPTSSKRFSLEDSPFAPHIKRISEDAKMTLKNVIEHIMRDEGVRPEPYPDSIGIAVGVGRNLTTYGISTLELRVINKGADVTEHIDKISIGDKRVYIKDIDTAKTLLDTPLTDHEISLLLLSNLRNTVRDAEHVFGEQWQTIDNARKEAIVDMLFNLGLPTFEMFEKTIAAIKDEDFEKAAQQILLSKAAQQNPARYQRIAKVMRTGNIKYFEE